MRDDDEVGAYTIASSLLKCARARRMLWSIVAGSAGSQSADVAQEAVDERTWLRATTRMYVSDVSASNTAV